MDKILESQDLILAFYYGGYMLKKINSTLQNLEQKKQTRLKKQAKLQAEIDDIESEIKEYTSYKKQYENLENKLNNSINKRALEVKKNE